MSDEPLIQLRPNLVEGVAILDLLAREMTEPEQAIRLGDGLREIQASGVAKRFLINASQTRYMSSTGFAVLFSFGLRVAEAGGKLAICEMNSFVRVGADIVSLGRIVPIFEDEATALASLILP